MRKATSSRQTTPKPAPKGGFVISDKSKAEMAAGKGTKSDWDKPRFDLFPTPEFMLACLSHSAESDERVRALKILYGYWGGTMTHDSLLVAVSALQRAMGIKSDVMFPAPEAMDVMARIATKGAAKYSDRNWENGMAHGRVLRAAVSHIMFDIKGEVIDPELQEPHLGCAMWNAVALYTYAARGVGEDSRSACHKALVGVA